MPRVSCGIWSTPLIALHVVSDVIIWLSYLWIPLVMLWAYRRHHRQLVIPTAVQLLILLYVAFITACGFTHFFDALMFWDPVYRINGLVRAATACVSLATAISLVRLIPVAITAPLTIRAQKSLLDQQQAWLRDILDSATGGKLRLCSTDNELPAPLSPERESVIVTDPHGLRAVRLMAAHLAEAARFDSIRKDGLITAVHEAAMNALQHAGGGILHAYQSDDAVQIRIEDKGSGIPLDRLPISTLKQGFSTAGQGWFLVMTFTDTAYLYTGPNGTTVVMEMKRTPPAPTIPFSQQVGGGIAVPLPQTAILQ